MTYRAPLKDMLFDIEHLAAKARVLFQDRLYRLEGGFLAAGQLVDGLQARQFLHDELDVLDRGDVERRREAVELLRHVGNQCQ